MDDLRLSVVLRLVDKVTGPLRRVSGELDREGDQLVRREERRAKRREAAGKAVAVGGAAAIAGLTYAFRQAAEWEEVFERGVGKIVEFKSPESYALLASDILDLSTKIPLIPAELQAAAEVAARTNLIPSDVTDEEKRAALVSFADDVGKIAQAFDLPAQRAADFMAALRSRMQLTQAEAMLTADAINHMDNTSGSNAANLVDIVGRIGGIAQSAGYSAEQIVALAAAFDEASPSAEIAATALAAFLRPLTAGEAATKSQVDALEALGMTADEVAKRMQTDATGVAEDIISGLQALEGHRQGAIMRLLVGDEGVRGLATILNRGDRLKVLFDELSDPKNYRGSVIREYENAIDNANTKWQLIENTINAIAIDTGEVLLPEVQRVLEATHGVLGGIKDWGGSLDENTRKVVGLATTVAVLVGAAFLSLPIAAGAAIGSVVYIVITRWEELKTALGNFFDWLKEVARETGEVIREALQFEMPEWAKAANDREGAPAPGEGARSYVSPVSPGMQRPGPPGRALGGPASTGTVYEWQEEDREFFVPTVDGRVITNRAFQELRGGRGGDTVTIGDIHVHAAPGQSAEEIARTVLRKVREATRPRQPLHDGPLYG